MAGYDLVIRQGDTTPALTQTILDANGNVLNLSGATVTFIMRSLTATAPQVNATASIVDAGAGKVSYSWAANDTATAGLFQAVFRVTGLSGGGTYTHPNDGYLDIWIEDNLTSDTGQLLVSVADAKDYLGFSSTDRTRDQKLTRFIRAIRPVVELITGPVLPKFYDEWYPGGHHSIVLRHRPVLSVQAVSNYLGAVEFPFMIVQDPQHGTVYSCMLDTGGVVVRRGPGGSFLSFWGGPQAVHIEYTAGLPSIPENVRLGTLELIRVNYQETQQGGRRSFGGVDVVDDIAGERPAMGYLVPNRVREMLQPTRRAPSIG